MTLVNDTFQQVPSKTLKLTVVVNDFNELVTLQVGN